MPGHHQGVSNASIFAVFRVAKKEATQSEVAEVVAFFIENERCFAANPGAMLCALRVLFLHGNGFNNLTAKFL